MSLDKQRLAVFDFDGTLIKADSFPLFLKFAADKWVYPIMLIYFVVVFLSYKLRLFPARKAKELMLTCVIRGKREDEIREICKHFILKLRKVESSEMMKKLREHQKNHDKVIIVSASPTDWIKPWAEDNGFDMVIGASLEIKHGKATGRLDGENCRGRAKITYLKKAIPDFKTRYETYGYGDSVIGDKPLLDELDHSLIISQ